MSHRKIHTISEQTWRNWALRIRKKMNTMSSWHRYKNNSCALWRRKNISTRNAKFPGSHFVSSSNAANQASDSVIFKLFVIQLLQTETTDPTKQNYCLAFLLGSRKDRSIPSKTDALLRHPGPWFTPPTDKTVKPDQTAHWVPGIRTSVVPATRSNMHQNQNQANHVTRVLLVLTCPLTSSLRLWFTQATSACQEANTQWADDS